jgi:hypothetical protein
MTSVDDENCDGDDDVKPSEALIDGTVEKPLEKSSLFCFFCIK